MLKIYINLFIYLYINTFTIHACDYKQYEYFYRTSHHHITITI